MSARKKTLVFVIIGILLLAIGVTYYNNSQNSPYPRKYKNYIKKAISHASKSDNGQKWAYAGVDDMGCKIMVGCMLVVKLKSQNTGESEIVWFHNGKIMPTVPAKS